VPRVPGPLTPPPPPQERRRNVARLERMRNGITLVDKQLDALRSSELDKELMRSLRDSSTAMKKAGLGAGVEDAENIMTELDDQIREASELTSVLATPIVQDADDIDLDAELGLLELDEASEAAEKAPARAEERPRPAPARAEERPRPAVARADLRPRDTESGRMERAGGTESERMERAA
jgi:hypothetical protein